MFQELTRTLGIIQKAQQDESPTQKLTDSYTPGAFLFGPKIQGEVIQSATVAEAEMRYTIS